MIRIWKYKVAPKQLKDLYSRVRSVEWVLKSPPDLVLEVEVLFKQGAATEVSRCSQHDGTIVFFGRSKSRP